MITGKCQTCAANFYRNGDRECVACADGEVSSEGSTSSDDCGPGNVDPHELVYELMIVRGYEALPACIADGVCLPDPRCQVGRACVARSHVKGEHYLQFPQDGGDCSSCRVRCAGQSGCSGYECGQGECWLWLGGACSATTDSVSGLTTCSMSDKMQNQEAGRFDCAVCARRTVFTAVWCGAMPDNAFMV